MTGAKSKTTANEVVEFSTKKHDRAAVTFTIDGVPVVAREPKQSFMIKLGKMMVGSIEEQVVLVDEFLDKVFDPEHAQLLRERLEDEADEFDIDDLSPIMEWLETQWSDRPTGSRGASRGPRRSPGRRSTARAR